MAYSKQKLPVVTQVVPLYPRNFFLNKLNSYDYVEKLWLGLITRSSGVLYHLQAHLGAGLESLLEQPSSIQM